MQEGVTVTPSRESVIWDENTRKYVQSVIEDAKEEAAKLVQKELKEDNFFKWVKKCAEIINRAGYSNHYGSSTALSVITRLVDKGGIKPKYPKDPEIQYSASPGEFFWGLNPKEVSLTYGYGSDRKVDRSEMTSWNSFNPDAIYLLDDEERHSNIKDRFLTEMHGGSFLVFKKSSDEAIEKVLEDEMINKKTQKDLSSDDAGKKKLQSKFEKAVLARIKHRDKIYKLLTTEKGSNIKRYSEVEVPEDFQKKAEEAEEKQHILELSPAEKRAQNKQTVCYTYKKKSANWGTTVFKLDKVEPKVSELGKVVKTVYYNTSEKDHMMKAAAEFNQNLAINDQGTNYPTMFETGWAISKDVKTPHPLFLRFSKRNLTHIKKNTHFKPIDEYFYGDSTEDMKTLGEFFIPYFTAEYIQKRLLSLPFFSNFSQFNNELHDVYSYLKKYVEKNYERRNHHDLNSGFFHNFERHAHKVRDFQLYLLKGHTEEEIKAKSVELFGVDDVTSAKAVDIVIIRMVELLEEYAENVKDLFNGIDYLAGGYTRRSAELRGEEENIKRLIQSIIDNEGLDEFSLDKQTSNYFKNLTTKTVQND